MNPKVKICGITNIEDAREAVHCGADALGFVFYKKSPRFVTLAQAKRILTLLPPWVVRIGLFVHEDARKVKQYARIGKLDFVQLHGDESRNYLRSLNGLRIIKAIRVKDVTSLRHVDSLPCEMVLFDACSERAFGGTGKNFNWKLAARIRRTKKPYIVSGGLHARNVEEAIRLFRPYAVDVSSGVEQKPGKKNKKLLREFMCNVKKT